MEKLRVLRAKAVRALYKNHYEHLYWEQGKLVCGIDEAGRGPLAGPVVAAAAIIPMGTTYRLLKDSKIMTEEERNKAYAWLCKKAYFGVGIVQSEAIDRLNIWHATIRAMRRAVMQLMSIAPIKPSALLIDAVPLDVFGTAHQDIDRHSFVFGERKSISIAAASIIAKVTRDAIMKRMDPLFPLYLLGQHKGYATPTHKRYVIKHRPSIIHRVNYVAPLFSNSTDNQEEQQSIFSEESIK